jgi:hypothetical protein
VKLRKADGWTLAPVSQVDAIKAIEEWHYSKSAPNTGIARTGLFDPSGELCGVALWLPPTKSAAITIVDAENWRGVLHLSRFAVAPGCPPNAASFFLGRTMNKVLDRKRWPTLLSYADTAMGHTGAIYLATNWTCLGEVVAGDTWQHVETGEIRGRKRGGRNISSAEMRAAGFERRPNKPKIKFVHGPHRPPTSG